MGYLSICSLGLFVWGLLKDAVSINVNSTPNNKISYFWVTVTKASGSTSPGATGVIYVDSPGLGTFRVKESGASSNDDFCFTVMYLKP